MLKIGASGRESLVNSTASSLKLIDISKEVAEDGSNAGAFIVNKDFEDRNGDKIFENCQNTNCDDF